MIQYSTLYETRSAPQSVDADGATVPDPSQWCAGTQGDGTLVYQGQPGTAVPAEATRTLRDGSVAWTWGKVAREVSADWRAHVMPHTWGADQPSDDIAEADWPLQTFIMPT